MALPNPVPAYLDHFLYPLVGTRMLELGNKRTKNKSGVFDTYKDYFTAQGIDHTSIDWNGEDGALKLDLRKPIDLEPFDMITNLGTTEHVSEQEPVWRNIHNLLKVGGVFVNLTPMKGDWWWHGEWYPQPEFFEQFAELNGYRIDHLAIGREHPYRNIDVRMTKLEHKTFVMPDPDTLYNNIQRRR